LSVIDTHVLLWYLQQPDRLGRKARRAIETLDLRGALTVSAVSFFEIALLFERGRNSSTAAPHELRVDFLSRGGKEIPLDGAIAVRAGELARLHDPFDRFIVATADLSGTQLITADERILDWPGHLKRLDART
jgi:PIN domain nuclease of toxin-antitoxin system